MTQNAIEILIDVAAQEGIDSVDDFMGVVSSAAGKVGVLSDSIDELDGALASIAKSGASAEDMAAAMVTTLEDFGVQVKDADGLADTLAGTLTKLGVAGKEAASGVDLTTKANEELAGSADTAAAAVERQSGAVKTLGAESDLTAGAMKGFAASSVASSIAAGVAVADLGEGFTRMSTLAGLATPALMKAATWAGIGLAGLAYEGIKQYSAFNKLITQTITQAGEAPSKMGFLTNLAESVAKSTGANLDDVANTIYRAASGTASWNAGLGATKAQLAGIVTTVSKLNIVGGIASGAESEQSSRVITALLNSNIRGVGKSPIQAAALANAVVGSGDIRYSDLVPAVGRGLLASAVANNLSAKDALAWVDTLTSQGTTGSVAGNYVKTGINLLAHPSAQGTEALAMLGIKPGELENEMTGPGGLTSALSTLKAGMKQLNPGNAATFFFNPDVPGQARPGGSGLAGALAKLQTWSANELPKSFTKAWMSGTLNAKQQTEATDLILTKGFGGSKQFATIAGVLNNLNLFKGIEGHIGAEDTPAYFNAQYRRTEATPSVQFKKMGQNLLVDLVNIGKTLTPLALTFGHIMTGVIDGLSKFKGVIMGFATLALGLLGVAGVGKIAELGTHLAPLIGAGYNRLGSMMGKDSAFTTAMNGNANGGAFKFLNIYKTKSHGIVSKLGGESIMANGLPDQAALSADGTALNTTLNESKVLLQEIATNTRVTAGATEEGDMTGGGARFGGGGGAAAVEREGAPYTPQLKDPVTGKYLSYADSAALSTRMSEEENASQMGAYYYGSMGKGRSHLGYLNKGGATDAAEATSGAEDVVVGGTEDVAAPLVTDLGTSAAEGGLGEMLGGIAGGPVGMMGMMMAPMLIGAMTPLFGKLGGLLGDWFSGGKTTVYNPHLKHPLDVTSASAKLASATKALRAYQREVKNKAGKETWVNDPEAIRANGVGYLAAHKAYLKAGGENAAALKNANAVDLAAFNYIDGNKKDVLKNLEKAARKHAQEIVSRADTVIPGSPQAIPNPTMQKDALKKYVATLPKGLQGDVWKRVNKNGPGRFVEDYQNIGKILGDQQRYYKKTFSDASSESLQALAKHSPVFAAMDAAGLLANSTALDANRSEISKTLNNKTIGPKGAVELLPLYAEEYHKIYMADQKALSAKTASGAYSLTGSSREAAQNQEKQSRAALEKTNELIREMRKAAADTKLDDGSVRKLATQNAKELVASGLPTDIANALAGVLSQYIKLPKVTGTGAGSSKGGSSSVDTQGL